MPLFMDIHEHLPEGATAADVADAHSADLRVQDDHEVRYLRYWVDDSAGKVFCLVDGPGCRVGGTRAPRGPRAGRRSHLPGPGRTVALERGALQDTFGPASRTSVRVLEAASVTLGSSS